MACKHINTTSDKIYTDKVTLEWFRTEGSKELYAKGLLDQPINVQHRSWLRHFIKVARPYDEHYFYKKLGSINHSKRI